MDKARVFSLASRGYLTVFGVWSLLRYWGKPEFWPMLIASQVITLAVLISRAHRMPRLERSRLLGL